jgi:hypothetical protein
MRNLFEFNLVQNPALGAIAVHAAVIQCYESTGRAHGASLPPLMLVVPMVFHKETRDAISGKVLDGSFYKAIADNRAIPAGLQHRMEAMSELSFASLNLGAAAKLIERDPQDTGVFFKPRRLSAVSIKPANPDVQDTIAAAKRIGHWIATIRLETLCSLLGVRF